LSNEIDGILYLFFLTWIDEFSFKQKTMPGDNGGGRGEKNHEFCTVSEGKGDCLQWALKMLNELATF